MMSIRAKLVLYMFGNFALAACFGAAIALTHTDEGPRLLILLIGAGLFTLVGFVYLVKALSRKPKNMTGDTLLAIIFDAIFSMF